VRTEANSAANGLACIVTARLFSVMGRDFFQLCGAVFPVTHSSGPLSDYRAVLQSMSPRNRRTMRLFLKEKIRSSKVLPAGSNCRTAVALKQMRSTG
jgi:hypothetical protein